MDARPIVDIRLNRKQSRAWELLMDAEHTEVLYGGGAGSGKSWLGCVWLIYGCLSCPGSRWLMGRAVLKTLKETTLNTFFEVISTMGMTKGQDYSFNGQAGTIHIGESQILLKDLFAYPSDPNFDELGSLELTGAFIDEANQTTEKARDIVASRIRYKLDEHGRIPKLLMTCNPARNWVYTDFYKPWTLGQLAPHRAFVPARVTDNEDISRHYIQNLERLKGADRARLLEGDWEYSDDEWQLMQADAVYSLWINEPMFGDTALTWDVAGPGSDRSVVMLWRGLVLMDVLVLEGEDVNEQAKRVMQEADRYKVPRSRIVVDATGIGTGPSQLIRGCVPFKGGASPIKGKDYRNLKAECIFALADAVNEGMMAVVTDKQREDITRELLMLRQWKGDRDGKIQVTPKKELRKDLGRSPDLADAMMMRMYLEIAGGGVAASNLSAQARGRMRKAYTEAVKRGWR